MGGEGEREAARRRAADGEREAGPRADERGQGERAQLPPERVGEQHVAGVAGGRADRHECADAVDALGSAAHEHERDAAAVTVTSVPVGFTRVPNRPVIDPLVTFTHASVNVTAPGSAGWLNAARKVSKKKLRIKVTPMCSTGLTVHAKVTAKKAGAAKATWTRKWRVDNTPPVKCRIRGTG